MKINWWPWGWLALASLALLLFFVVYPLGVLLANSVQGDSGGFTLQGFAALLKDSQYLLALRNTLVLGLAVTACTVALGVPFAYVVARYDFPFKRWVAVLPVLTIVIPEIIEQCVLNAVHFGYWMRPSHVRYEACALLVGGDAFSSRSLL